MESAQSAARIRRDLRKKVDWFSDHADQRGKFTGLQLLKRGRIVVQYLLDLDAEPLKDDCPGEAGSASSRPETDFLASQVLYFLNIGVREDVHLRNGQANDVIDLALEVENFPLRAEILENVRLGDRDVDLPQIEQIVEVGRGAIGDDRNDAQIVSVVEDVRELIGEGHIGARQLPADDADRPMVLANPHCSVGAAPFKRLGHGLRLSRSKQSQFK